MSNKGKGKNFLAGIHSCVEAMKEGRDLDRLFIKKGSRSEALSEMMSMARERGVPISYVPIEKLDRLTTVSHQGVVGIAALIEYSNIEALIPHLYESGKDPLILVLDRVTDVRNFGAICRTAECMGVHAVVIPEKESAQVNVDAMKTSAGALSRLPICRVTDLKRTILFLQNSGMKVVAATEKGSEVVHKAELTGPLVVVMGSEEDGVSEPLIRIAELLLKINMPGETESLNVSVAAGMFLYEIAKQREG